MVKAAKIYIAGHCGLVDFAPQYLVPMPANPYRPADNYHPENSHVIPALSREFREAKVTSAPTVTVWGTGTPKREFLYSDDMADPVCT